jgi:diguanylate cyclase (GGDEF)-like protein
MIDINQFKRINDEWGHSVGDDAIRSIGWLLANISTANITAFRTGGDEFVVLLLDGTEADIEKLRLTINERISEFNETAEKPYKLSVSMGASTTNTSGTSLDLFFHELDRQMYEEKVLYDTKNKSLK